MQNNKTYLLLYIRVILLSFLLMMLSGCDSDNNVMQEPVEPEEIVEAEAELEPEEMISYINIEEQLIKVEANPEKGFYWDYYLFIPDLSIPVDSHLFLLVSPNNTGTGDKDIQVHDEAALRDASSSWKNSIARSIEVPLLVPVFPREFGKYYTHQLERDVLLIRDGNLRRIDLQLIAMVEDARELLNSKGLTTKEKILLNGFSACGTFSIRFAILHPHLVRAVAAGGLNGLTTFPTAEWDDKRLRYPTGIADLEEITGIIFDLEQYKEVAQYLYMGSLDDNDTIWDGAPYLSGEDIKLIRGITAEEVQERWAISQRIYKELGIPAEFKTYTGVGHTLNDEMLNDVAVFFKKYIDE